MRRFLLHVLPAGFHRIRHYGLLANGARKANLTLARELLNHAPAQHVQAAHADTGSGATQPCFVCRHCGGPMLIVETFVRGQTIRAPPQPPRAS